MANRYFNSNLTTGANDGTSETDAWRTIAVMVAGASAGDVIYVADGIHSGGAIAFTVPVTLKALNKGQATLRNNTFSNAVIQINAGAGLDAGIEDLILEDYAQDVSANGSCFMFFVGAGNSFGEVSFQRNKIKSVQMGSSQKCGVHVRNDGNGYTSVRVIGNQSVTKNTSPTVLDNVGIAAGGGSVLVLGNAFHVENNVVGSVRSWFSVASGTIAKYNIVAFTTSTAFHIAVPPVWSGNAADGNFSYNTNATVNVLNINPFVDPDNVNLELTSGSPALSSGVPKTYESTATFAADGVKWLDFTEVGGTGTGLDYSNPVRNYTEWQAAYASGDIWVVKGDPSVGKIHDKGGGGWAFPAFPMTVIGEYQDNKAATLKLTAGVNQVFNGTTGSELVTKHLTYSGAYGGNPVNGIFYNFDKITVESCFLDCNELHSGRVFQLCDDVEILGTLVSDKGVNLSIAQSASVRLKAIGCTFAKLTYAIVESGTSVEALEGLIVGSVIGWGNLTQPKNCVSITGSTGINASAYVTLVDDVLFVDSVNGNYELSPKSPVFINENGVRLYLPTDTIAKVEGFTFNVKWADFNNTGGTNAGTYANPWESEQAILNNISSSDLVVFKEGTHLTSRVNGLQFDTFNTGNAENNYILDSEFAGDRRSILQAATPGNNFTNEYRFNNVTLLHGLRNLIIKDSYRSNGPCIIGSNPNFIIENCDVIPWRAMSDVLTTVSSSIIRGCVFADREDVTATSRIAALNGIIDNCIIYTGLTRTVSSIGSTTVRNTIVHAANPATPISPTSGMTVENCYYNQGSTVHPDFIQTNLLLIDPANGNYELNPNSIAANI